MIPKMNETHTRISLCVTHISRFFTLFSYISKDWKQRWKKSSFKDHSSMSYVLFYVLNKTLVWTVTLEKSNYIWFTDDWTTTQRPSNTPELKHLAPASELRWAQRHPLLFTLSWHPPWGCTLSTGLLFTRGNLNFLKYVSLYFVYLRTINSEILI